MEITQVKVFPVHEDKLKAFVSVVFDHCFMVNDIKVIQGKDGLFLSMPSRRKKSGEFKDVAHPLNNETRRMLEERVLEEYRIEVGDRTPRRPDREAGIGAGHAPSPTQAASHDSASRQAAGAGHSQGATSNGRPPLPSRPVVDARQPQPPVATASGNGRSADPALPHVPAVAASAPNEKTLEEIQEMHLRDSFWSVS